MAGENLNIVFAVDHSGSMNGQDGQQMVSRMLKEFIDTVEEENVHIGYVAYNDSILARNAPAAVGDEMQKKQLKETIDSVKAGGETDIGLGLSEAYHLMDDCTGKKMVVLISDGETDLDNSKSGRTEADSDEDIQEIIQLCGQEKTPVVTIAFGSQYEGEESVLTMISGQTAGASFKAQNADELMGIFYQLLFVVERQNMTPAVEWEGEPQKNTPAAFEIVFTGQNGGQVRNAKQLESLSWQVFFENEETKESIPAEIKRTEEGLIGNVTFRHGGSYRLVMEAADNTALHYEIPEISVSNALPQAVAETVIGVPANVDYQEIDLDEIFTDADGDALTYLLEDATKEIVLARVDDHTLILTPQSRGNGEVSVLVSDGEASLIKDIPVRVKTPAITYWVLAFLAVLIAGLILFRLERGKKKAIQSKQLRETPAGRFSGKLNAYFTLVPDSKGEVPPLTFALHPIREKKIVLGAMFKDYPDLADMLDLDNIYLMPAENRKLILYQNCNAGVMLGNSIVCRKMQYAVNDGNVIYITSRDGDCELEVHYISMI